MNELYLLLVVLIHNYTWWDNIFHLLTKKTVCKDIIVIKFKGKNNPSFKIAQKIGPCTLLKDHLEFEKKKKSLSTSFKSL